MAEDYKLKIIMLLQENEKLMAELYAIFAERFPEDKLLWEELLKAELEHAETIETLYKQVIEKTVFVDEGKSKTMTVQALVNFTKGSVEKAKIGKMTRINALSIGKDIENSLLEKKYFTFFKSSSVQFNELMQELSTDTAKHFRMLESRWEMVRKSSS